VKKYKVGDVINMQIGQDNLGPFWWANGDPNNPEQISGPFRTEQEAETDFNKTMLPDCTITEGGQWDPNWNKKQ
jgi:hypothetical protein